MILPEHVKIIIGMLEAHGYEAYAVGGCVRDTILGKEPEDWDITTSAKPEQIKAVFRRTVDTGIKHGTVTVLMEHEGYEVTTYRIDGEYEDGRHPREVQFTSNLTEDLRRRDFTINAMAYNERDGLVDRFGGLEDIRNKVIRCVGSAQERFEEDALRIMRAVRFSAQLGFEIEEETRLAIEALAENLRKISAERIQTELVKLLCSSHPEYLRAAWELGITRIVLPEFDRAMETPQRNPHHCYSVGEHTLKALEETEADRYLRLAVLFHDFGKPDCKTTDENGMDHFYGHPEKSEELARNILKRLKFDNDTIYFVTKLVRWHDQMLGDTQKAVRRAIQRTGEDIYPLLFAVKRADMQAQSSYKREEKEQSLERSRQLYEQVKCQRDCLSLKTLAVTGRDLIRLGFPSGPRLGEVLNILLSEVLDEPAKNTKEYLEKRAQELL